MNPYPMALITGGAVRLGKAIALELARAGYAIGLHYHHSAQPADETAAEIAALEVPVHLFQADLTRPDSVERLFQQVKEVPNPLSVLVNSAAVMPHQNLQTMSVETWDRVMDLNLRAAWLCTRFAAPLMKPGGVIINISDAGAHKTWLGFPAYQVSKAALETLTRLQARALAPGLRVNAVAPGLILPTEDMPAEEWERLIAKTPLQVSGSGAEIGRAVLFIINSPHMTGAVITIDGGYQLVG